jgi:peptide/nickel transport system substrate-binding protein
VIVAVTTLSVVLAGCSGHNAASSGDTSTLVMETNPVSPFIDNFNPFDTNDTGTEVNATGLVYEPLLQFDTMKPGTVYPWLAKSYAFSNDGKTVTFDLRTDAKWSDGQAFTSADAAFTFNMVKANKAINTYGLEPTSVSTPDSHTLVLNFDSPQYTQLFYIGSVYMVPQHIWGTVKDPSTWNDSQPVGTGPYKLASFTSQGFTLSKVSTYWQPVKIPNVRFPSYVSNTTASLALSRGEIDWAANDIANIDKTFVQADPQHNKYWFAPANVVTLQLNTTRAPLNNAAVRRAISAAVDRAQLSAIGETGYEQAATSSGGLLLEGVDDKSLDSTLKNNLAQNKSQVSSILTGAGYTLTNGKWVDRNGNGIKFTLEDPSSYSDYFEDITLIAQQLNAQGFQVGVNGTTADAWVADYNSGNFDATLHWGAQGPSPYYQYDNWLDSNLSAPVGQTAAGDQGRYSNPAAQAALAEFASTNDPATQQDALNKLQQIVATDAPVIPLLYGAAWDEYSTKKFTGWPTKDDPYIDPVANTPWDEYTVLHLTPVSS